MLLFIAPRESPEAIQARLGTAFEPIETLPPPPSGTAGKRFWFRSIPVTKCARGFRRGRDSGHVEAGRIS